MKKFLFKHALSQEMSFYDEKTVGDIKSAMDPMAIVDIISWRVPFIVAETFKLLFIIINMIQMNWQLTVSSLAFLFIFKLLLYPIEKVIPSDKDILILINAVLEISSTVQSRREDLHHVKSDTE